MERYLVILNFNIVIGADAARFDEQTVLIEANGPEEAYERAVERGRAEEEIFLNAAGEEIRWVFISVSELIAINDVASDGLLFTRSLKKAQPGSYADYLKMKALAIQAKSITFV